MLVIPSAPLSTHTHCSEKGPQLQPAAKEPTPQKRSRLLFLCFGFFEIGFCYVAQDGLKIVASSCLGAPKELVSQTLENISGGDSFCIVLFEFHSASFGMELSVILLPQ